MAEIEQLAGTDGMTPEEISKALKEGRLVDYLARPRWEAPPTEEPKAEDGE